jgi:gamma-glutamylcyclotransferase (GGCT)/AIG2-like uncharacterized protein YtfP
VIPAFDPHSYPGPRPTGPVLVHAGGLHHLRLDGPSEAPLRLVASAAAGAHVPAPAPAPASGRSGASPAAVAALDAPERLRWSVAYGSNASPGRLVAKGLDRDGAVLLPARLVGFVPAFEHRRTGYGAVPLTLVPAADVVHDTWVLGLPADATDLLDRTEGRTAEAAPRTVEPGLGDGRFAPPGTYRLARVGDVAVADRFVLASALAYLPGPATRVQLTADGRWRTWPGWVQEAAGAHVDRAGPDRSAPHVEDAVLGPWPSTPLSDLPLFVYGTLRPDGSAWRRIADLVRVIGPATTAGILFDTGQGWPAARFLDASSRSTPTVSGYLVAARGPEQAQVLFGRTDRYERVPTLFVRTSVQVDGPNGRGWAAGYAWAHGSPPGVPIPTGKWVVR